MRDELTAGFTIKHKLDHLISCWVSTESLQPSQSQQTHHTHYIYLHHIITNISENSLQLNLCMDNKVLENRLTSKDSVIGGVSVTKCALKLHLFQQNQDIFANNFIKEVLLLKLDIEKEWKSLLVLSSQNDEYEHLEKSVVHQIIVANQNTVKLSSDLAQGKIIGRHRFEINDLAVVVNNHPSKSCLKRKLNLLTENVSNTEQLLQSAKFEIHHRFEQCKVLNTSILNLQTIIIDDKPVNDLVDAEELLDENQRTDSDRNNRLDYTSVNDIATVTEFNDENLEEDCQS